MDFWEGLDKIQDLVTLILMPICAWLLYDTQRMLRKWEKKT